jgi:pimeloyl-ACP methyl ester carboxylesterase
LTDLTSPATLWAGLWLSNWPGAVGPRPDPHDKIGRIPQASITTLPDVGHVPMLDDPELVARTILTTTGARLQQD